MFIKYICRLDIRVGVSSLDSRKRRVIFVDKNVDMKVK